MKHLTKEDFNIIMESLRYTKLKFEEYTGYPNTDFKAQRIAAVVEVMNKIKEEIKDWDEE